MEECDLIFEIHHGGRFKNLNGLIYVGGDISIHGVRDMIGTVCLLLRLRVF